MWKLSLTEGKKRRIKFLQEEELTVIKQNIIENELDN